MTDQLVTRYDDRVVGRLRLDAEARFCFRYEPSWAASADAFPISLSLPFTTDEVVGGAAHAFFANLLPEGTVRTAVCRRLGISEANDFALLRAIGGECAGALTVGSFREKSREEPDYERLSAKRLQSLVENEDLVPLLVGGQSTRLSLAGAQDKLPVAVIDGQLHLPLGSSPSTHILKFPNRRYAHLPANEAFVMGFARRLDLDVVETELYTKTAPASLLVTRYDRRSAKSITRLHQEDFCQALGLLPSTKYEQEGGPSLARVAEITRSHSTHPLIDIRRLVQWQAFNVAAGNSDGHGKNLSILYDGREVVLAPFYDLLSTRHYETLDRKLAMSVGGRRDPDQVLRLQWETLARDAGLAPRAVLGIIRDLVERIRETLPVWTAEFRSRHGREPILQALPGSIDKRARSLARKLGT